MTRHVLTSEDCFVCGDVFAIETDAVQDDKPGWVAFDGDPARCVGCGAVGWVSLCSETEAWVNYDEQDPTNVAAYDNEEVRGEMKRDASMVSASEPVGQ